VALRNAAPFNPTTSGETRGLGEANRRTIWRSTSNSDQNLALRRRQADMKGIDWHDPTEVGVGKEGKKEIE